MTLLKRVLVMTALLSGPGLLNAGNENLDFHEDYYLGFSQGAYYGLLLAEVPYDVAWCVKGELAYEAANLGAGSEFQEKIEAILDTCNEQQTLESAE